MKRSGSSRKAGKRSRGYSLAEMLVAMGVFLTVSAAALSIYSQHQPVYRQQQELSALNLNLRNAMSQLQLDLANAGTGVVVGANIPNFPIGVSIQNSVGAGSCYDPTTNTYTAQCFDTLHIVAIDPNVPPMHPEDIGTNCVSTTSSILFAQPPSGMTAAQAASYFHQGDQLLVLKNDGSQLSTVVLSQDGGTSGGKVRLQHNPTAVDGTNSTADDPLFLTVNPLPNNKLGTTFCDNDWVLKLNAITYRVDTSNPSNPVLVRQQGGQSDVVADQVIGFKVGASLWNGTTTSSEEYNFDSASYGYDFSLIRSVRISLIGRTTPNTDPTYKFRNTFDQGPYQIQGISIVVNPRNLSMKD